MLLLLRGKALRVLGLGALFVVVLVANIGGLMGDLLELRRFLAVEEGRGLLERETLGLDDEEVEVHRLEREPAAVHELYFAPGQNRYPSASGQGTRGKMER